MKEQYKYRPAREINPDTRPRDQVNPEVFAAAIIGQINEIIAQYEEKLTRQQAIYMMNA